MAYKRVGGGAFRPSTLTAGPWHPSHQHAGPVCGLVAQVLSEGEEEGLHLARLTSNLIRPVPVDADLTVEPRRVYGGRNSAHWEASLLSHDQKLLGTFTGLFHRPSAANSLDLPDSARPKLRQAPRSVADSPPTTFSETVFPKRDGQESYNTFVELKLAAGDIHQGPSAVWFRMTRPLIEGTENESVAGMAQVAVAADSASGTSAVLDWHNFTFFNTDLSIHLVRPNPVSEWVCVDAVTFWDDATSNGMSRSAIYDEEGLIGVSLQSLMARPRQ